MEYTSRRALHAVKRTVVLPELEAHHSPGWSVGARTELMGAFRSLLESELLYRPNRWEWVLLKSKPARHEFLDHLAKDVMPTLLDQLSSKS